MLFKPNDQSTMISNRKPAESVRFESEYMLGDESRMQRSMGSTQTSQQSPKKVESVRNLKTVDIKSNLSIIANSATVEVWIIDEDLLGLLPPETQKIVLNRIKA